MKVYVGNLPYSISEEQLKQYFGKVGAVTEVVIIKDRHSGRSKGFGFVQFENADDAKKAIEQFHGQDFEGRNLVVNVARPKRDDNAPAPAQEAPAEVAEEQPQEEPKEE